MVQEFIENFLYQNSPQPKGFYGQFPMSEGIKSELGLSKKFPYEGFSTKYQGPDKTGLTDYAKKGLRSIFSNVPETGIGGGTAGQRIIYENLINNPILRNIFNMGGRALQFGSKALGPFSLLVPSNEQDVGEMTPEIIEQEVRARNAARAQESRNQSKDDYTGGGDTVTIGKGGGETKVVDPRSREAMYAAPAKTPDRGPLSRFNTGGLAELEGDTRQLFPVEGGGGLTRRGPFFGNANLNPPLGIASVGGQLPPLTSIISGPIINRPMPMPMPFPGPRLPEMPDYSSQFEQIGEQLGGFGKQLDALGSFNEQVGGIGKQFESVNNKLDSLEKGLGSLGNQIASFENMQKAQPQEVMQPRRPSINPFGLANLFMNMRRF